MNVSLFLFHNSLLFEKVSLTVRDFASLVDFSEHIAVWEKSKLPGQQVLEAWRTGRDATIEFLYKWAVEANRMDIVKILEEDPAKN